MKAILGFVSIDFRGYKLYKRAFGGGGGGWGAGLGVSRYFCVGRLCCSCPGKCRLFWISEV